MLLQLSKTVKQSPKSPQIFENNGTFCADRPFSKNRSETNCQKSFVFNQLVSGLQSYILSTTTETYYWRRCQWWCRASIVHPFNNNWNQYCLIRSAWCTPLQSYILSTTTETISSKYDDLTALAASIVHPFNNNWNIVWEFISRRLIELQSYILSTTTETAKRDYLISQTDASIVHPFNNNWN